MMHNDNRHYLTVIPAERSESRDPWAMAATLTGRMGPGSRRCAAWPG
jgi:hypothetical protein